MIRIVDTGTDPDGATVVEIQAEGPLLASDMQTAPAGAVCMVGD